MNTPHPAGSQYNNVSATSILFALEGGPDGGYGGHETLDEAPPPDSYEYGQQPPPGALGGSAAGHPMGSPSGADPQLRNLFAAVNTDNSGRITARELAIALMNGDWSHCTPFDIDMVKMLMSIFDTDRSGTIGFNEFAGLWEYIKYLQNVFRNFDRNHSGSIDGGELQEALSQIGFQLSDRLLKLVQWKYGTTTGDYQTARLTISFDRFIRAYVDIDRWSKAYQKLRGDQNGWNYDDFMYTVLTEA
ncbi:EF-hand [Dendrothele bispora CBS 962.96]|uniref:EF-hand n=1 Tax=Dendrothele bispora (strain CBS 962.96) TaxID=1314807 RepID=A0A4V4HED4_DENBC|nr:EF-hand [Dendrothele bispora CBS 962.96]